MQDFDLGLTSTNAFVGTVTTRFAGAGGTYDLGLTNNNTLSGTVTTNVAFGGPECLLVVQIQGTRI